MVLIHGRDDGTTTILATLVLFIAVFLGPVLVGLAFRLWDRRHRHADRR
jgi:hypothetical protein